MRLLWVNDIYIDKAMSVTSRIEIIRSLRRLGVQTHCVFWVDDPCVEMCAGIGDNTLFECRRNRWYKINRLKLLIKQCNFLRKKCSEYDFIIVEPRSAFFFTLYMILISGIDLSQKFILDIRSVPVDLTGINGTVKNRLFKISVAVAFRYFAGITIITEELKKQIVRQTAHRVKKIGIWSSGFNQELFDPQKVTCNMRHVLGLNSKFILFYHGSLSSYRGIQTLILSVDIVRKYAPNIMLILLGNGQGVPEFNRLVRKHRLEEFVKIYPRVPYSEVPNWIAMADLPVIPLPENDWWNVSSPLKLMEYMAMAKPIALTGILAHRNVVYHEPFVFYFKPGDIHGLAQAIGKAIASSNLKTLGKLARVFALENYTWDKQAHKLLDYLTEIGR